jgi:hypothetical protein
MDADPTSRSLEASLVASFRLCFKLESKPTTPASSPPPLNTLICLPFSCSDLLVPHCCCSAFWIAVTRSAFCTLHRSVLRYVAVIAALVVKAAATVRGRMWQIVTNNARIFASNHLNLVTCPTRPLIGPTIPRLHQGHGSLPVRLEERTTHHVSCVQGGGVARSARLGFGVSCIH